MQAALQAERNVQWSCVEGVSDLTFQEHWSLWRLTSCIFNKSHHFRMLTAVLAVCMLDV